MIFRLKILKNTYLALLKPTSLRSLSNRVSKKSTGGWLNYVIFKHGAQTTSSIKSSQFLSCLSQDKSSNQHQDDEHFELSFCKKLIICSGVVFLCLLKFVDFAECEKQSKAEKEKCWYFASFP